MEQQLDKLLKIKTSGRDDSRADQYRYPYEPTPYSVLERLAGAGYIGKKNTLLDYGCGKGRVDFYLSYHTKCRAIGIDFDERLVAAALRNKDSAVSGGRTTFVQADAVSYPVPAEVDRCYFFNPFSLEVLQKAMGRILESYYEAPREIRLFFYYPSDEFVGYLMTLDEIMFCDEIDLRDLFPGDNKRERILIFEIA